MATNYFLIKKSTRDAIFLCNSTAKSIAESDPFASAVLKRNGASDGKSPLLSERNFALHIGKSAAGWYFRLATYPELGIKTLDDWRRAWNNNECEIFDEYGIDVEPYQMLDIITNRKGGRIPDWERAKTLAKCGKGAHFGLSNLIYLDSDAVADAHATYVLVAGPDFK